MYYTKNLLYSLKSNSIYTFICNECKSTFERQVSDVRRRTKNKDKTYVYCSNRCNSNQRVTSKKVSCKHCNTEFIRIPAEIKKAKNHFCSSSCSAIYNNRERAVLRHCITCSQQLSSSQRKFCSHRCQHIKYRLYKIEKFEKGEVHHRPMLRKILGPLRGEHCSICKNTRWLGKLILLIVDHINGDSSNNMPENLRLVCSNCDATLPTYKAKNKGNGREYRRKAKARLAI